MWVRRCLCVTWRQVTQLHQVLFVIMSPGLIVSSANYSNSVHQRLGLVRKNSPLTLQKITSVKILPYFCQNIVIRYYFSQMLCYVHISLNCNDVFIFLVILIGKLLSIVMYNIIVFLSAILWNETVFMYVCMCELWTQIIREIRIRPSFKDT